VDAFIDRLLDASRTELPTYQILRSMTAIAEELYKDERLSNPLPPARLPLVEKIKSGWRVRIDHQRSYVATYIVDGSGRAAFMARRFGRRLILDRMVCTCWELVGEHEADRDDRLLVASDRAGWWYSIRTGAATRVLCRFAAAGRPQALDLRRTPLPALAAIIQAGRYRVLRASSHNASIEVSEDQLGRHWIAVGDAHATVDPLSGQGCFRAIADGRAAAYAVEGLLSGSQVDASALLERRRRAILTDVVRRRDIYASETRWVSESFWADRI
jgi:flavin-dependent dehydrogenase